MATSVTSQSTVATGDTIEAAYSNTNRDNVAVLDVRTGGDPGAADKWLVSTSSVAAAWVARATAVIAAIPNLGIVTAMLNDLAVTAGKIANGAVSAPKLSPGAGSNGQVLGYSGGNLAWFNQSDIEAGSCSGNAATASNSELLDTLDSTQFIRKDTDQTFSGARIWSFPSSVKIALGAFTSGDGFGGTANGMGLIGDFRATGTKNRLATGHDGTQYGIFHSFETPLPMFAEPGRAELVNGTAVVEIPRDIANYLDLSDYHVLLTAEGPARLHVEVMTPASFTVLAEPNDPDVSFSWFVLARQGDMGHIERVLPLRGDR